MMITLLLICIVVELFIIIKGIDYITQQLAIRG